MDCSGVFAQSFLHGGAKLLQNTTDGKGDININLNASCSNSLYKNNCSVQPNSLILNYVIKY